MYYSQANQDEFVFKLLNHQNTGIFVDIGSNDPVHFNNSYFLETMGWRGICVDKNDFDYKTRSCKFYNQNALKINYSMVFEENNFPDIIDYLSIDIDENTAACLNKIPLDKYTFKIITIEHDSYRFGTKLVDIERALLLNYGYTLLCKNVTCFPLAPNEYFEDWWIKSDFIDLNIHNIQFEEEYCTEIIKKLNIIPTNK